MLIILSCLLPGRCRYSPEWAAGLPQAGSAILGLMLRILSYLVPGRCRYGPVWAAGLPQASAG